MSVKSSIELLLQLKRIGLPKPDDAVSSGLEVEPMTPGSRVHQKNLDSAGIPVNDVLLRFEFPGLILGESLHESVPIMLEGPTYEDRLSPGVLNEFLRGFDLQRVHLVSHSLFIVHCSIGKLEELSGQSCCIDSWYLYSVPELINHAENLFLLERVISFLDFWGHLDLDYVVDALGEIEVVLSFHAHADVPYL